MGKKSNITQFLSDNALENKFDDKKYNTENFLEKLKVFLSDNQKCTDEYLEKELNKLVIISKKKNLRSRGMIVALWYFLSPLELSVIKANSKKIKRNIKHLMKYLIPSPQNDILGEQVYESFKQDLSKFMNNYLNQDKASIEDEMKTKKVINKQTAKKNAEPVKHNPVKADKSSNGQVVVRDKESTIVNVSINVQSDNAKMGI